MSELLPCPFCGGEAETYSKDYGDVHYWRVVCNGLQCAVLGVFHSEAEAIEAWNTRHKSVFVTGTTVATDGEPITYAPTRTCENVGEYRDSNGVLHRDARIFRCSECGYEIDDIFCNDYGSLNYCMRCGAKVVSA